MTGNRSVRVLVVDDSSVARRALTAVLEAEGFGVETATSARGARETVHRSEPAAINLILMDLHFPDGTGIDTCAYIKQLPEWADVPVIMVTSSDDEHDLTLAFAAGATDYITKPPRDVELRARVRAALRLQQEMDRRKARERDLERVNRQLTQHADDLAAARSALIDLNRTLEQRVVAQVEEILTRAQEVDALNAQLRVQVQERSHELAEALRRLSARHQTPRPVSPGTVLAGRVRLVRSLGSGGMGHVYAADDLLTGSRVAVKLLDPQIRFAARDLQRFIGEAAAAAAVEHPAIVKTLHVDIAEDGHPFLIMELVHGVTLKAVLAEGSLAPAKCAAIGQVVAEALAAAHRAGVVHRDIKPSNLIVCPEPPGVRVLDFGISKSISASNRTTWTQTGGLLGTPDYMSPEQFDDPSAVTPASDVYSLGVVMFEMAAGSLPHGEAQTWSMLRAREAAPRLVERAPNVPAALAAIVESCLQRDCARRPTAWEISRGLAALDLPIEAAPAWAGSAS